MHTAPDGEAKSSSNRGDAAAHHTAGFRNRRLALYVVCVGVLMSVFDTTIVTVALPTMVTDLGMATASQTWVVNAYVLAFGGSLILNGRLGDLYGPRRVFLLGIGVFTCASVICGFAREEALLFVGRAIQGVGGAAITSVSLSLIVALFSDSAERAMAIGIYTFVSALGGAVGEVLGGLLTSAMGWHWVFLINVPVGILIFASSHFLLPRDSQRVRPLRLDWVGAITLTTALTLLIYTLLNGTEAAWHSARYLVLLGAAIVSAIAFTWTESRVSHPLIPRGLLRRNALATASVVGILWAAGAFAWFVIAALYLQQVLHMDPLRVGLAFLPGTAVAAVLSVSWSGKCVVRYGIRGPLWIGLVLFSVGLLLFARAPVNGSYVANVLPSMLLLGIAEGLASTPLLLSAMRDVHVSETGSASGIANTAFMLGGAMGLAVLSKLADTRVDELLFSDADRLVALNGGYHLAFFVGALLTAVAAAVAASFLGSPRVETASRCSELATRDL